MIFLKNHKSFNSSFIIVLVLLFVSSICTWSNHAYAMHGQVQPVNCLDGFQSCNPYMAPSPGIGRASGGVPASLLCWPAKCNLFFDLEEELDTFLIPVACRDQSSPALIQSDSAAPRLLNQSYRSRRIYLHHRSFLC